MLEAVGNKDIAVRRISFKGGVQAVRQWEPHFHQTKISLKEKLNLA